MVVFAAILIIRATSASLLKTRHFIGAQGINGLRLRFGLNARHETKRFSSNARCRRSKDDED
jgi:hypothetical protein